MIMFITVHPGEDNGKTGKYWEERWHIVEKLKNIYDAFVKKCNMLSMLYDHYYCIQFMWLVGKNFWLLLMKTDFYFSRQ